MLLSHILVICDFSMKHLHVQVVINVFSLVPFAKLFPLLDTYIVQIDSCGFQYLVLLEVEVHLLNVTLIQHEGAIRVQLLEIFEDALVLFSQSLILFTDLDVFN